MNKILPYAAVFCAMMTASMPNAQQLAPVDVQEIAIDPISFRGPDPAEQFKDIQIEQKLDAPIPLGLEFIDEEGKTVKLEKFFNNGKPVILSLVYYECPMLCSMVMNGMVAGFDGAANTLDIGKDYDVVTISIDPEEKHELAAANKVNYLKEYHRPGGEAGWHFLTGAEENIEILAQAVGFRFFYDSQSDQFAHASGIMIMTPKGRVSSYYLGVEYEPANLRMSLIDAASGKIGSLVENLVLLCFNYDPTSGTYGFLIFNALRLGGALTVLAILAFWSLSYAAGRRKRIATDTANGNPVTQGN